VDSEQRVLGSLTLLEKMAAKPHAVLDVLTLSDQEKIMDQLRVLTEEASGVEAEADLAYVIDKVHLLVAETPALAALLLAQEVRMPVTQDQATTRKVTRKRDLEAYRKSRHAQERAAQIRNHVVECRRRLEQALLEPPQKHRQ
jgi:hypothetical protein